MNARMPLLVILILSPLTVLLAADLSDSEKPRVTSSAFAAMATARLKRVFNDTWYDAAAGRYLVGFYNYTGPGDKHRMDLHLSFSKGRISGDGNDDLGRFLISGGYDASTKECSWVKQHIGRHAVSYEGVGEKRGIWGRWRIIREHGGFHIWPLQSGSGDATSEAEEMTEPARLAIKVGPLVEK